MKFFDVLKRRKILFLNIFLFLYIALNLFTGDRGLISYIEKKEIHKHLKEKKKDLEIVNIDLLQQLSETESELERLKGP